MIRKIQKELLELKKEKNKAQKEYDEEMSKIPPEKFETMSIEEEVDLELEIEEKVGLYDIQDKIFNKEEKLIDELFKEIEKDSEVSKKLGEDIKYLKDARKFAVQRRALIKIAMNVRKEVK